MSTLRTLPPSANWYSSSACDWSQNGTAAYASKNSVRLLMPFSHSMEGSLVGHSDRVTSLEFCRIPGENPKRMVLAVNFAIIPLPCAVAQV